MVSPHRELDLARMTGPGTANVRAWVVVPVHNRRATTIACLQRLHEIGVPAWLRILVVDDGSTDGTTDAIRREYPNVLVVRGDGNLWWTGAIEKGMREAMQRDATHIFWLNDDTLPAAGALEAVLAESIRSGGIASGVGYLPGEDQPAYGGYHRSWRKILRRVSVGDETVPCDVVHGNMVCIPRSIVTQIGYPDGRHLPHGYGDYDYSLRARRHGLSVRLVGSARGQAQPNLSNNYRSWFLSDIPLSDLWRSLARPGSFIFQPAMHRFYWRHWGLRGTVYCLGVLAKLIAISVLRPLIPATLRRRMRGGKSKAWQHERRHAPHV